MPNFYTNTNSSSTKSVFKKTDNDQIKNSEGAFVYEITDEMKLRRFLILGCENGTYYATANNLLNSSFNVVDKMIRDDKESLILSTLKEISLNGKARKNDQVIAVLLRVFVKTLDITIKKDIINLFPQIVRTGTHFFLAHQIMKNYVDAGEYGWSTTTKKLFSSFYQLPTEKLAFQMLKYRNRENWTWKDSLRLNHIRPVGDNETLFKYVVKEIVPEIYPDSLKKIEGFERAKSETNIKKLINIITDYQLPEEMIPTENRNNPNVQEALFNNMGLTSIIRHLGSYTASNFITQQNVNVIEKLRKMLLDPEVLKKAKIHPLQLLDALKTYSIGHGLKGNLKWSPVQKIVDILDDAFYLSFDLVEPTNKKMLFALDVSGSMDSILATNVLTAREASSAFVMSFIRNEPNYLTMAFSSGFIDLQLTPKMRLREVMNVTNRLPFDSTNLSKPFTWALENKIDVDAFVVLTDNEVNNGIHPSKAMELYCRKMNKPKTKLIVNATSLNDFTVADPKNPNQMDIVGFSNDVQTIASDFILGKI